MVLYKFRIKNKGRRCKKGESSSINPSFIKFREIAKSKLPYANKMRNSTFTKENVQKHEKTLNGQDLDSYDKNEDTLSKISDLTDWTNCSNTSFDIVFKKNLLNSHIHREILALLATITEIIQLKGGIESDSEYLAAFLTALGSLEEKETITAAVYLIKTVIKKVPKSVLVSKCNEICKILLQTFAKFEKDQSSSLLFNSIFVSLALILRAQPAIAFYESSTLKVFHVLLSYALDDRFKVRRMASKAINLILYTKHSDMVINDKSLAQYPLIKEIFEFSQTHVNTCFKEYAQIGHNHLPKINNQNEELNSLEKMINDALHCIVLLKDCYIHLPNQLPDTYVKSIFEMNLKLLTIPEKNVKVVCLKALSTMLESSYEITTVETMGSIKYLIQEKGSLNKEFNAKLLSALYTYEQNNPDLSNKNSDVEWSEVWIGALTDGVFSLVGRDGEMCGSHFVRTFQTLLKLMAKSEHSALVNTSFANLKRLLQYVLPTLLHTADGSTLQSQGEASSVFNAKNIVATMGKSFEKFFGQHVDHTTHLEKHLALLASFVTVTGTLSSLFVSRIIKALAGVIDVTTTDSQEESPLGDVQKVALDRFFAALVSAYGPENTLSIVPLNIDPEGLTLDLKRSWMLPLLRDNLKIGCALAYFERYFMPLARKLEQKAREHYSKGNTVLAKSMETLHLQVWSLLPGFASHATDLSTSLAPCSPHFLSLLTKTDDVQLFQIVCSALRNFTKNEHFISHIDAMTFYFKGVMPALFNQFSKAYQPGAGVSKWQKLQLYETIKACLSCCPSNLVAIFFAKLREKLDVAPPSTDLDQDAKYPAWLDLAAAFLPHCTEMLNGERSSVHQKSAGDIIRFILPFTLTKIALPSIQTTRSIQKKAYKILEEILINLNESSAWRKFYFCPEYALFLAESLNMPLHEAQTPDRLDIMMARYLTTLNNEAHASSLSYRFRSLTSLAQLCLLITSSETVLPEGASKSNSNATLMTLCSILNKALPEAISATYGCGKNAQEAALNYIEILLSNQTSPWLINVEGTRAGGPSPDYYHSMDDFMSALIKMSTPYDKNEESTFGMDLDSLDQNGDAEEEKGNKRPKLKGKKMVLSKELMGSLIVLNHFFVQSENFEENHMHMSEEMRYKILEHVLRLITVPERAIVTRAINFLCSALPHVPKSMAMRYSGPIAAGFGRMNRNYKKPLRMKIKIVLTKLCRKGNPDDIQASLPHDLRAMFEAIQKVERRREKKRRTEVEVSKSSETQDTDGTMLTSRASNDIRDVLKGIDSSDISDNEPLGNKSKRSSDRKTKVYINEGDPATSDGILDLLDPSQADKILVTDKDANGLKFNQRPSQRSATTFPMSKDGRLIISEDILSKKSGNNLAGQQSSGSEDSVDEDEFTNVSGRKIPSHHNPKGIKRKNGQGPGFGFTGDKQVRFAESTQNETRNKKSSRDPSQKHGKNIQPYAYYPLDPQASNIRKKAKLNSKLKGIVGSARKGALAGNKSRFKSRTRA